LPYSQIRFTVIAINVILDIIYYFKHLELRNVEKLAGRNTNIKTDKNPSIEKSFEKLGQTSIRNVLFKKLHSFKNP
jgi:hypothetical protein